MSMVPTSGVTVDVSVLVMLMLSSVGGLVLAQRVGQARCSQRDLRRGSRARQNRSSDTVYCWMSRSFWTIRSGRRGRAMGGRPTRPSMRSDIRPRGCGSSPGLDRVGGWGEIVDLDLLAQATFV